MNKTQTDQILKAQINLYYDLQPASESPAPLLIALHGYGAYKEQMMREAQQMAPDGFAIASLQGFHQHIKEPRQPGGPLRYGFGWLTNYRSEDSVAVHHQALLDLIDRLAGEGVAGHEGHRGRVRHVAALPEAVPRRHQEAGRDQRPRAQAACRAADSSGEAQPHWERASERGSWRGIHLRACRLTVPNGRHSV